MKWMPCDEGDEWIGMLFDGVGIDLIDSVWILSSGNLHQCQFDKSNSWQVWSFFWIISWDEDLGWNGFILRIRFTDCATWWFRLIHKFSQLTFTFQLGISSRLLIWILLAPKQKSSQKNSWKSRVHHADGFSLFEFSSWMNAVLDMDSQHHGEPSDCIWIHHHHEIISSSCCFQPSEFLPTPILHSIQQQPIRWIGCVLGPILYPFRWLFHEFSPSLSVMNFIVWTGWDLIVVDLEIYFTNSYETWVDDWTIHLEQPYWTRWISFP